jgi:hypothetical protein
MGSEAAMQTQKQTSAKDRVGTDPEVEAADIALTFSIPDVPELHMAPRRIDEEDEIEIRWRFGEANLTVLYGGGSGFGMQLERAAALGFGPLPCRRCGGRWRARRRRKDGVEEIVDWRDGTGLAPRDHFGKRVTYAAALAAYRDEMKAELHIVTISGWPPSDASGSERAAITDAFARRGELVMTESELRESYATLPEDRCRTCPACAGIGVVPRRAASHAEITARPTGSSKQLGGQERDDVDTLERKASKALSATRWKDGFMRDGNSGVHFGELQRYVEIERILADVARISPLARAALELYYTPSVDPLSLFVEVFFGSKPAPRRKTGWKALSDFTPASRTKKDKQPVSGLHEASVARQAAELYDFACKCFNVAAYGVSR